VIAASAGLSGHHSSPARAATDEFDAVAAEPVPDDGFVVERDGGTAAGPIDWSEAEIALIASLSIDTLPPLPSSPGNPAADDQRAIALGHRLFFDQRLGSSGSVSCATCHVPEMGFADGRQRGQAIGETRRRTMTLIGAAWSPWLFWDGRRDSLWSQALEPLEDSAEHGGTRLQYVHLIASDEHYRAVWPTLFGDLPDAAELARLPASGGPRGTPDERAAWASLSPDQQIRVSTTFADIGRALEAYQRTLVPAAGPFDEFARSLADEANTGAGAAEVPIDARAQAGLRLFIGRANCVHCHNGPLLTNNEFHATGIGPLDRLPEDRGRIDGVIDAMGDEFNCLGQFSSAPSVACAELAFVKSQGIELVAAFRTPTLRGVASRGPYMHDGSLATLGEVLDHYNEARPTLISDELEPLELDDDELDQLEAFLDTLDGGLTTPAELLSAP